jgi:hypothetical protein
MTDFPLSLIEFQQRFDDEAACATAAPGSPLMATSPFENDHSGVPELGPCTLTSPQNQSQFGQLAPARGRTRPAGAGFTPPYAIAVVELDEGPRMMPAVAEQLLHAFC